MSIGVSLASYIRTLSDPALSVGTTHIFLGLTGSVLFGLLLYVMSLYVYLVALLHLLALFVSLLIRLLAHFLAYP
jgi:hypothetical protein